MKTHKASEPSKMTAQEANLPFKLFKKACNTQTP